MERIAVISGVSRGLGRALAEEFLSRGIRVWGCARSEREMESLREKYGELGDFRSVDVSKAEQVAQWAEQLLATGEVPYWLINNAALINRNSQLWKVSVDEFDAIIDVNVKGSFYLIKYFLPAMVKKGSGIIINFSSGWGRSTSPEVAPYCASKWAIEGLTRALAQELPPGMAAIPLNPGIIHTDMLESCFGDVASQYPSPREWSKRAADFILSLGPEHNGQPLSVPI